MAYTTKRPTGLSIKRSGAYFICTWKIGDENYSQGQTFQWRVPGGKWQNVVIGNATTQKTIVIDTSTWYPYAKPRIPSIIVRIRGRRGEFDGKNPAASAWTQKEYDIQLPPRPTLTATLSSSENNKTTFTWETTTSNDSRRWCSRCQYQTALVTRGTVSGEDVPHSAWSAAVAVGASDSVAITEDSGTINRGTAYIRWFRVRSQGPQGFSEWVYAKHIYAVPYQTKNVKASARMTDAGGYLCTATWKTSKDVLHPVSAINVQYLITIPAEGMTCPDGVTWTDAMTLAYKDGSDAAAFSVDNVVGVDQCLFVRINTVHDRNTTYGNATLVASGALATPTSLTVTADDSTHMATVTATNASQVPDAYMAILYRTQDDPDGFVIGIIEHGATQTIVQCPAWDSQSDVQFGVYAVVGEYTLTTRADGVGSYVINELARSAVQTYGGTVPAAPADVTLEQTTTPETVRVTFKWSWAQATMAELSWADHEDAWESTDGPSTYIISRMHASAWNISGLETGKTWYIRVRLASGAGNDVTYGAYSDIASIDLSSAPSVPILSVSSGVITEDGTITASWAYTSTDGTGQESADIAEVVNGVYSVLANVASEQNITFSELGWSSGETHLLAVRVTSESGKQSAWSDPVSVTVAEPLTVSITQTSLVEQDIEENAREYSGDMVTYESEIDGAPVTSLTVNIEPVQSGSGDPSPSNIRPISGWESVSVTRCSKNLCKLTNFTGTYSGVTYTISDGVITVDGTATANVSRGTIDIPLKAGTYTVTNLGDADTADAYVLVSDTSTNPSSWITLANLSNGSPITFTLDHDIVAAVRVVVRNGKTVSNMTFKLMLVYGSDAPTEFEPYNGNAYNISLSSAGTVYGGTLDVVSGELTVYPYYASYNGEALTGEWISDRDVYAEGTTPTIGAQVVNIGAEGTEYQLDPHEISSLLGANNIWSDAGDVEVHTADVIRTANVLTEMPLTVTVEGAGTGGTTSVIIERAETYHVSRPDETEFNGFEGETIAIATQTGESQITFDLEDLIGNLDDEASYRLIAAVQDGLGQSAEVTMPFEVHWSHQAVMPTATVSIRTDDMVAVITPSATNPAEGDVCDIYRLSVDKPELIYPDAEFGAAYVDPYPAIGEFGGHRVVYKTANGDYITADNKLAWADCSDNFVSDASVIDFDEGQVLVEFNTDLSHNWSKDFKETKYLGGSVKGDWNPAVSRTGTFSGVCTASDPDTIEMMRRLAVHAGICHVRTKDGSSYAADVQVSESYAQDTAHKIITFNLSITRVDSEGYDGMTLTEWEQTHAVE